MPKSSGKVPTRTYGQIHELELLGNLKKLHKPKKHFAYQVDVTWSDGATRRVYRSYDQVFELYTFLSNITKDGGLMKLAGRQLFERSSTENFASKHLRQIEMFVNSLLQIPHFMQQSDMFLWFWEPNPEDTRISDIDRTLESNTSKYNVPSAMILNAGSMPIKEDLQDYICVCTALSTFTGQMPDDIKEERGLPVKEGDVIYVLRMSNCPAGYWLVRNVFGSEGVVPVTTLRVDQDILQRKKRRSQRLQQNHSRLEMVKSAENLADRSMRLQQQKRMEIMRSAENLSRRKSSRAPPPPHAGATPLSPPISRTLRDLNNSIMSYVEPAGLPGYGGSRRRSTRPVTYNESMGGGQQATHDLIKSLHETSLMLQDRMALSEMESQRRRLFEDLQRPATSSSNRSRRSEVAVPHSDVINQSRGACGGRSSFVRSPSKRGVRVSARFKRMSPSPTKFISPCRKGIRNLRVAAPSPLAVSIAADPAHQSPSQNVTFEQSPGTGLKRSSENEGQSPTKKKCSEKTPTTKSSSVTMETSNETSCLRSENYKESTLDSGLATSREASSIGSENVKETMKEEVVAAKPRRRSDIARRVSLRLKHVYGKSPVRAKVPRRNAVSADRAV